MHFLGVNEQKSRRKKFCGKNFKAKYMEILHLEGKKIFFCWSEKKLRDNIGKNGFFAEKKNLEKNENFHRKK